MTLSAAATLLALALLAGIALAGLPVLLTPPTNLEEHP